MTKNRKKAWDEYRRTGINKSNFDLNDRDEIAAITGWDCARNKGRAEAFRNYHRTGVNHSEYDLTDHDQIRSIFSDRKNRR